MVMTESEIYRKVQQVVVDALCVDEEEVTPEARLTADLGAESIDYLDIAFQLERTFGLKIEPSEMMIGSIVSDQHVQDGKVTDAGMAELRTRVPHGNFDFLEQSRLVEDFQSVFTVETLVRFVAGKLDLD